jgi:hypothetical protein
MMPIFLLILKYPLSFDKKDQIFKNNWVQQILIIKNHIICKQLLKSGIFIAEYSLYLYTIQYPEIKPGQLLI